MSDRASIQIVKTFPYRGDTREFSNRYHVEFTGTLDSGSFSTLADQVVDAEKLIHPSSVHIVRAEWVQRGSDTTDHVQNYATAGTRSTASGSIGPGDSAALVRYATDAVTTRNHPIYLFNYYHAPQVAPSSDPDELVPGYKTLLEDYANFWIAGPVVSGHHFTRCGPRGAAALSRSVEEFVTHRDLPRRS